MKIAGLVLAFGSFISFAQFAGAATETVLWTKQEARSFEVAPSQIVTKDGAITIIKNFKSQMVGEKLSKIEKECYLTKTLETGSQQVDYQILLDGKLVTRVIEIPTFKIEKNVVSCPA